MRSKSSSLVIREQLYLCRREICNWSKNLRKTLESLKAKLDYAMSDMIPIETLIHELN